MWYNGNYGPVKNDDKEGNLCVICYATSRDGINWEKPNLGLVEFKGSRQNNIVELDAPTLWSTFAVLHDPEDPNPARRFKAAYEAVLDGRVCQFCVAFSPDGLRWKQYANNPVGSFLEMAGITKHRGVYYVNGQAWLTAHHPTGARRLVTFASADFEHWSPCGAVGLDRAPDVTGPSTEDHVNQYEEVHLGAGLWNRGNVIVGIYGQWHGHFSGDRKLTTLDLGLALTHDAIHFCEPIPGFRFIPALEQPEEPQGLNPAIMQGQGMENVGDRTLYWYSLWRGTEGSGVRMVSWPRDQLGMLKPFHAGSPPAAVYAPLAPQAISLPIQIVGGSVNVYANASGLGQYSRLRIGLLDEGFRPINGFSGDESAVLAEDGFRIPVRWKGGDSLLPSQGLVRLDVRFEGVRPEDCALHAIYISGE
jgi:hypothetical protein